MSDPWVRFNELDRATQERLAGILETRGSDKQQQVMRRTFLNDVGFKPQAEVLEVGCGTGVLTRVLAGSPNVRAVVGTDLWPNLLAKAVELASDVPNVTFQQADGRCLPFDPESFDAVVFDSVLSHMPSPDLAVAEAFRVLRPNGQLAVFDGDYATMTVALGDHDPLQACVETMIANYVNDRWLVRRLPALTRMAGFDNLRLRSYGYAETNEAGYMLTVVDRGVDMQLRFGQISADTATALKAEARRRVQTGTFFGHLAYASAIARKPV